MGGGGLGGIFDFFTGGIFSLVTKGANSLWDAFIGVVVSSVDFITGVVLDVVVGGSEWVGSVLGPAIKEFFGFQDELIVMAAINTTLVFEEGYFENTRRNLVIERLKNPKLGSLDYIKSWTRKGDSQFRKYYNYGRSYFLDYLPEVSLLGYSIDQAALDGVATSYDGTSGGTIDTGYSSNLVSKSLEVPKLDDWAKYVLRNYYDPDGDVYIINGNRYALKDVTIGSNDYATAYLEGLDVITITKTYTKVTHRNHVRYVSGSHEEERTEVVLDGDGNPVLDDNGNQVTRTYTVTVIDYDYRDEKYTDQIVDTITKDSSGNALSNGSRNTLERVTEYFPDNTLTSDDDYTTSGTTTTTTTEVSDITRSLGRREARLMYVVKYADPSTGHIITKIIDPANVDDPVLSDPIRGFTNNKYLEVFPIACLRNDFHNLKMGVNDGYITDERYEATRDMLNSVGIDLENLLDQLDKNDDIDRVTSAFFVLGVRPYDTDRVVSEMLYELLSFIEASFTDERMFGEFKSLDDRKIAFNVREDPYNACVSFTPLQSKTVRKQIIYDDERRTYIGNYFHEAKPLTLIKTQDFVASVTKLTNYDRFTWNQYHVQTFIETKVIREDTGEVVYSGISNETTRTVLFEQDLDAFEGTVNNPSADQYSVFWACSPIQKGRTEISIDEDNKYTHVFIDDGSKNIWQDAFESGKMPAPTTEGTHRVEVFRENQDTNIITAEKQVTNTSVHRYEALYAKSFSVIKGKGESSGAAYGAADPNFVIPLPVKILFSRGVLERARALEHCSCLVFYAMKFETIDWYATEAFANFIRGVTVGIMIVITVVVTIFTAGSGTGAAITLTQFLENMLINALIAGALTIALYAIDAIVQDPYLKAGLSAVAVAVSIYFGGGWSAGDMLVTAASVVQVITTAIDVFTKSITKQNMSEIEDIQEKNKKMLESYEDMTAKNMEIIAGFNETIQPEQLAAMNMTITDPIDPDMLTPAQYRDMALHACYQWDVLYNGQYDNITNFVDNKLLLGFKTELA